MVLVTVVGVDALIIYYAYPRVVSTHISEILAKPTEFNNKEAPYIFGAVVQREEDAFKLSDGTGSLWVKWGRRG